MEETTKKTFFEKLKEIIPLVSPLLMFSAIAFTYFTYFFDVHKIPQVIIQNTITKLHETDDYYIVKLTLKIKNQSKTRVEIIANLGRLYAYKCRVNDLGNDSMFIDKIVDTTHKLNKTNRGEPFEIHQTIDWHNEHMIGFYQPLHNSSWMLPEETFTHEIISAVPRDFDVVYYYYTIDFTDDEKGIFSRYVKDIYGDPEYQLYEVRGNDTITIRESNIENEDSLMAINSGHNIYISGSQYVAWLNTGGSVNLPGQKSDSVLTEFGDNDEK